ncbi:MAG TPA: TatD family hydrolase [Pyrinomonadaceae bacterium]|nr:TatD family hydrolase [Pyrinomonadaceae bacterium]HMP64856.1 TatD family hydrolase [Pyrinomonadaceae bacterium]
MNLVDSHCHIDGSQFDGDRDEVIERAREAGVAAMLNVGTGDPRSDDFRRAVAVAEKYENVYASVGVHPHDAELYDEGAEEHLIELAKSSEKVIAWGEIGLDYYYDHSPRDVQMDVFRRQIRVAKGLGLPIIVHSRDANDDTVQILTEEYSEKSEDSKQEAENSLGIMHCFGGTAEMAKALIPLGFLISFAGNVTFKKAEELRGAARAVPLEKLLVETDCPYLTPVPFRGKRNEPAMVVHTAKFLAEFYGINLETLTHQTTKNFLDLFKLDLSS